MTAVVASEEPLVGRQQAELADASLTHLLQRLSVIEARVRGAVDRRRAGDPDLGDRFRGLYISESDVDRLLAAGRQAAPVEPPDAESAASLARIEAGADAAEAAGHDLRLRRLARTFTLCDLDVEALLIAIAPDLDPRLERLYAYLHDDVSRRRPSVGLALELCGASPAGAERSRLGPAGALVADELLVVEEPDRPFLSRSLRVPDRVTAHLLGDDAPDPLLRPLVSPWTGAPVGDAPTGEADVLEGALRSGSGLVYVRQPPGGSARALAAAALARLELPALALDLGRLTPDADLEELVRRAARDARLLGGAIVAGPLDAIADRGPGGPRALAEAGCPVVLFGCRSWDPQWARQTPVQVAGAVLSVSQRRRLWRVALDGTAPVGVDPAELTLHFRLDPDQIARAAEGALRQAAAAGRPVVPGDLRAGARVQNAAGLERLARRIEPKAGWDDLVLPAHLLVQLGELVARVHQRDRVFDEWGMGRTSSAGRGVKALFAGDSGTGKTMSAEVVAHQLGLDLYVIDLSTVVDKYVGETEKNLDRIFAEADQVNGVLLFDEADALFGKRSEVKDAHDRYANVEVAYLLQRMEQFEGLAVLTTNLRSNLDEAFARRLDAIIDFPMPEEEDRHRLWAQNLAGESLPRADDIDVSFLAQAFRISGGNIRNIVVGAAHLAAEGERPVGMDHLIRATEREYRKLGHLCVESEFGPYFSLVAAPLRT